MYIFVFGYADYENQYEKCIAKCPFHMICHSINKDNLQTCLTTMGFHGIGFPLPHVMVDSSEVKVYSTTPRYVFDIEIPSQPCI